MVELAELHSLELPKYVAVEFPANVKDESKAIEKVGGPEAVARAAETKESPLELRLRDDPFEHPINSRLAKHQNILLKVSVAKRHFEAANGDVRKALELSEGRYEAVPTGIIESNFRFREMADYQYNTKDSKFATKFRESIGNGDLEALKKLELDGVNSFDVNNLDVVPPPRFSSMHYAYPYAYKQNPAVTVVDDGSGGSKLINKNAALKLDSVIISWKDEAPQGPRKKLEEPTGEIKECVDKLRTIFSEKPVWTRRGMLAHLPNEARKVLKQSIPHVAYMYKSGPYRGAYVRYGVDVSSSSEYAIYQVEHFRLFPREEEQKMKQNISQYGRTNVYTFDGVTMPNSGMMQFCDITDPQITEILEKAEYREKPHHNDGWYVHRYINTVRNLMRIKLHALKDDTPTSDPSVQDAVRHALDEFDEAAYNNEVDDDASYSEGGGNEDGQEKGAAQQEERPVMQNEQELLKKVSAVTGGGEKELGDLFGYVRQEDQMNEVSGYNIMGESSDDDDDYSN
jgi:general transcription factor 3C polypeptide 5 (transcription factor C subunit 1)